MSLPSDYAWHQSDVAELLKCPRRFRLRRVDRVPVDHTANGCAALLGTADHAGIAHMLSELNRGRQPTRKELRAVVLNGFAAALDRSESQGETTDPDSVGRAMERIDGERLDRLEAMAADPRTRAIKWLGIEQNFQHVEPGGRRWAGTVDAWGIARQTVHGFGVDGRDVATIRRGEAVLVDWKTGMVPPFGHVERRRHVQLGLYAMALSKIPSAPKRWRTFLGTTVDLDRPKAPTDEDGKRIPKKLPRAINPAFVAAHGGDEQAARDSRRRPKDAAGAPVSKWLPERINPEWEAARARPRGPFFREARVDYRAVLRTVRDALRLADEGIYPASGAVTGQCGFCPFARVCTESHPSNQTQGD